MLLTVIAGWLCLIKTHFFHLIFQSHVRLYLGAKCCGRVFRGLSCWLCALHEAY